MNILNGNASWKRMLCVGEAHRVQLINLSVDHGKGRMEPQSAQETKL